MFVDILLLIHSALVLILLISLVAGVLKNQVSKPSALLLGFMTVVFAILPQLIIRLSGASSKFEYYMVYGIGILLLLIIGLVVRKKFGREDS